LELTFSANKTQNVISMLTHEAQLTQNAKLALTQKASYSRTPTPKIPTPTLTPTKTKPVELLEINFRLIYATFVKDDNGEILETNVWVLEPPYQIPQLLYTFQRDVRLTFYAGFFVSHDRTRFAFQHFTENDLLTVGIGGFENEELEQLIEPIPSEDYQVFLYRNDWSQNNNWLHILTEDFYQFVWSAIVDTDTKERHFLDYRTQDSFLAWVPTETDQYVYISRPNFPEGGGETINIGRVGSSAPLKSITDFSDYILTSRRYFSLSSDGEKCVLLATDKDRNQVYLLIDFTTATWEELLFDVNIPVRDYWSPDGKWLVFIESHEGFFFLNIQDAGEDLIRVAASGYATPIGWLTDSSMLVYQERYEVYGVNPNVPRNPILIQDFSYVLQDAAPYYQIDLIP
jgi:hypothetical protein